MGINRNAAIGVFDSGLGGLTVVREIRKRLPNEQIVYFGDIARLPYGIKSARQIREFSDENTRFLLEQKVKAVVIACNSSSSAAFEHLSGRYEIPIVDVISPVACEAAKFSARGRIGILATQATVASKAYDRELRKFSPKIRVFSQACPLLVPLVEEGILKGHILQLVLKRYLEPILRFKIDTLILGCTHFPLLHDSIKKMAGRKIRLLDSAPACVRKLETKLSERNEMRSARARKPLVIFLSDAPLRFERLACRFLGEPLGPVNVVSLQVVGSRSGRWVAKKAGAA